MPKQKQATESKSDKKSRPKFKPTVTEELTDEVAGLAQLRGSPVAAVGDGTIQTQAAWLGNPRLQNTQRQALAAQIGRVQGNKHLQRVVASLKLGDKTEQETGQVTEQVRPMPGSGIQLKPT